MKHLAIVFGIIIGAVFVAPAARAITPNPNRTAYVHLFEWTWEDIALECENFLGPAGYGAVQVSPPEDHAVLPGNPWYQRYQPVSYTINSRSGNREQFQDMVRRCKAVGVDIYADAVINHMTWANRTGHIMYSLSGNPYGLYDYPGTYAPWDFHQCGRNGDNSIQNYQDRWEVQNCDVTLCADLKTENEYVRGKLVAYLNDLLSLGVAGFRIDAAKHMPDGDLQAIFSRLNRPAYIFQEVIDPGTEPIKSSEYFSTGDVTEFKYSTNLTRMFTREKLTYMASFGPAWGFMPEDKAVVFVDNHDLQRSQWGGGILTYKNSRLYALANVFMLAWPYGYTQVMSSYRFNSGEQGPPADANGVTRHVWNDGYANCGPEWVCEHRWAAIAAMVGFRNATSSERGLTDWWSNGGDQIAFGRGNKGFIVINKEEQPLTRTFQTSLPPGQYCDVLGNTWVRSDSYADVPVPFGTAGACKGNVYTVNSDGQVQLTVAPWQAAALHVGARLE